MRKILVVLMFVLVAGCSGDEPPDFVKQNNEAPKHKASSGQAEKKRQPSGTLPRSTSEKTLTIEPAVATKDSILKAKASGFPLKDTQIIWLLNGLPTATPRLEVFDSPELGVIKGDTVQAKAVIDGTEVMSNIVSVANAKPVIENINFVIPDTLEASGLLSVNVTAKDEDDDPITLNYSWKKNGEPAGEGPSISMELKRGDEFGVTITPFDGEEYGREVSLARTVGNFPPRIAQQFSFTYESGVYRYQVRAEDPDGDTVTYALKSGPEGMSIDPSSGEVSWRAPADFKGAVPFVVAAMDGQGGETQMELNLIVDDTPASAR